MKGLRSGSFVLILFLLSVAFACPKAMYQKLDGKNFKFTKIFNVSCYTSIETCLDAVVQKHKEKCIYAHISLLYFSESERSGNLVLSLNHKCWQESRYRLDTLKHVIVQNDKTTIQKSFSPEQILEINFKGKSSSQISRNEKILGRLFFNCFTCTDCCNQGCMELFENIWTNWDAPLSSKVFSVFFIAVLFGLYLLVLGAGFFWWCCR